MEILLQQGKRNRYSTVNPRLKKLKEENKNITKVDDFRLGTTAPAWFRGYSYFQMKAADNLLRHLRDDYEERSTYRVRAILETIGLSPLPTDKRIRQIMNLSRCSDLAFLYFLMESDYKYPPHEGYTLNEQLILSLMVHLDTVTTLRELDRLLPPPHPSLKEIQRQNRVQEKKRKDMERKQRRRISERGIMLSQDPKRIRAKWVQEKLKPYFENQRRPALVEWELSAEPPGTPVNITPYDNWKDPNYEVPNERFRWFTKYVFHSDNHLPRLILDKQMAHLFDAELCDYETENVEYLQGPERRFVQNIIMGYVDEIVRAFESASISKQTLENLCLVHRTTVEMERKLQHELNVIAREQCMQYFDLEVANRARKQEILQQLEKDVEAYMCIFKKQSQRTRLAALSSILAKDAQEHTDDQIIYECVRTPDLKIVAKKTKPTVSLPSSFDKPRTSESSSDGQPEELVKKSQKYKRPSPGVTKSKKGRRGSSKRGSKKGSISKSSAKNPNAIQKDSAKNVQRSAGGQDDIADETKKKSKKMEQHLEHGEANWITHQYETMNRMFQREMEEEQKQAREQAKQQEDELKQNTSKEDTNVDTSIDTTIDTNSEIEAFIRRAEALRCDLPAKHKQAQLTDDASAQDKQAPAEPRASSSELDKVNLEGSDFEIVTFCGDGKRFYSGAAAQKKAQAKKGANTKSKQKLQTKRGSKATTGGSTASSKAGKGKKKKVGSKQTSKSLDVKAKASYTERRSSSVAVTLPEAATQPNIVKDSSSPKRKTWQGCFAPATRQSLQPRHTIVEQIEAPNDGIDEQKKHLQNNDSILENDKDAKDSACKLRWHGEFSTDTSYANLDTHNDAVDPCCPYSRLSNFSRKYIRVNNAELDVGMTSETQTERCDSESYFQRPTEHQPYKFDYRKIFNFKRNTPDVLHVKRALLEALDADVSTLNKLFEEQTIGVEKAVENCAENTWQQEVAKKNVQMEEEKEQLEKQREEGKTSVLPEFKKRYYDCDNQEEMTYMLKIALAHMAKNPKFVAAALPDVHKLPLLTEWIRQRYGKLYTPQARNESFRHSFRIFNALDKMRLHVPIPQPTDIGSRRYVDYGCYDYVKRKADFFKKQYNNAINEAIMEHARVFWLASRPYLSSRGPPRNTYFAYMPARTLDIQNFRLWRRNEHMPAREAWLARMRSKKGMQIIS